MAGFNFFIIKNKGGELRAFHNVCRHVRYKGYDTVYLLTLQLKTSSIPACAQTRRVEHSSRMQISRVVVCVLPPGGSES
jgi:nitrite reductase/ring-hydroxylating ferredoxin subunit